MEFLLDSSLYLFEKFYSKKLKDELPKQKVLSQFHWAKHLEVHIYPWVFAESIWNSIFLEIFSSVNSGFAFIKESSLKHNNKDLIFSWNSIGLGLPPRGSLSGEQCW